MITYGQLRAARPAAWHAAASAWRRLAAALLRRAEEVRDRADRLGGSWSGTAADAALARLRALAGSLDCAAAACLAVDQILAGLADRVAAAQRALPPMPPSWALAGDRAAEAGAPITEAGAPIAETGDAATGAAAVALAQASAADEAAALRLHRLLPDLPTDLPTDLPGDATGGGPAPGWPPASAEPAAVRRWWEALTAAERRWLLTGDPRRLGGLDGVPADVRDRANRLALAHQRHLLAATGPAAPLRALEALHARLTGDTTTRAYLLGFDASGDGRAVVAIGDPDRAANVLSYVPGTGANLADLGRGVLLPATDRLAAAAGVSTAVVLWLGYDAPDNPAVASSGGYARRAEAALDRFSDGLRATHEGPRAHQVVLGHSYGSTVIGYTARDRGLDADEVIFAGSPGVGVVRAADLGLPAGQVWASTAAHDPIRLTAVGRALGAVIPPTGGADLWFGADPSRPGFGGRVFDSAPGSPLRPAATHDAYFDEANPAFHTIVGIVTGTQS